MWVIIMLSRKLHSHLACWNWLLGRGFWLDFHYWVVSGLRTSGDWSQGGPRRRCIIGRSSLSAESRSTTSPREEWSRHFVRQGTFPSPPFRIWRTTLDSRDIYPLDPFLGQAMVIIPNAFMPLRSKTNIVWFIDLSRFLAPSFSGGRLSKFIVNVWERLTVRCTKSWEWLTFRVLLWDTWKKCPAGVFGQI